MACGTPRSSNLKTEGFYVEYTLETRGDGAPSASGVFRDEGATGEALELVDGDAAYCDDLPLAKSATHYGAYEATLSPGKSQYVFELRRPGETAVDTIVPAPRAFQLGHDPLDGTYEMHFVISFTTSMPPPSFHTRFEVRAQSSDTGCPGGTVVTYQDSVAAGFDLRGQLDLPGSSMNLGGSSQGDCHYQLDVVREDTRDVGPPFIGGKLVSRHIESTTIHVHR